MMYNEEEKNEEHKQDDEQEQLESSSGSSLDEVVQADGDNEIILPAKRQHIAAIIFMFIKTIKELIIGFGLGLILALKEAVHYVLYFGGGFFLLVFVISILSWLRFTYRVEANELRVESGIIIRKKTYVPINRIHTINYSANIIHRIFSLVKVKIDTASGGTSELDLSAITKKEGDILRQALGKKVHTTNTGKDETEKSKTIDRKITWKRLILAGSTTNGIGAILFALYLGGSQLIEFIPTSIYDNTIQWFSTAGVFLIIGLAVLAFLFLYLASIAGTVVKYAFFTIEKHADHLFIKRGLIETKELTIPYDRIQSISIKQNLLRQIFGFVTVHATVVGNIMEGEESTHPTLFPFMHKKEVLSFIKEFTPAYTIEEKPWNRVAKKAWIYYIGLPIVLPIVAVLFVASYDFTYVWIPILFLLIISLLGFLSYRISGFRLEDDKVVFRKRLIHQETRIMLRRRIQALEKSQHKIQQIQDISSVRLTVFGGLAGEAFRGAHYDDEMINQIGDWYSRRTDIERTYQYYPGNNAKIT